MEKIIFEIYEQEEESIMMFVGDFNINVKTDKTIIEFFKEFGLEFNIEESTSSTNGFTQIDLIFSNIKNITAEYSESLFSYHKPIVITIDMENSTE